MSSPYSPPDPSPWPDPLRISDSLQALGAIFRSSETDAQDPYPTGPSQPDALFVLLPLLIVLSAFLFLLLIFLVCVLLMRRRRGIILRDADGPVDMSREDLMEGEGGFEGVEERWLENVPEAAQREYLRSRDYQLQYQPNSLPTDITLSQFLTIQEKGVSAWCFEPDYEAINSLLVHARTEVTFLPDPASSSCVLSNLPLPKLNEVYYWEVKMFDLPETTSVAVGLVTKPYPPFRLPGLNRYSVAYHSNGDKSFNWPFTAATFGPVLKEGDVLGVGYRPRTGAVFFTRNGRKMEDAFVGLSRWNLFPTIGADGPCSVHVNLGQAGFVFIEANVKKWGLAPSIGTLAPPPAYGSERGSILLDVGGRVRTNVDGTIQSTPPASPPSSHRARRLRQAFGGHVPSDVFGQSPSMPPPPITPIDEAPEDNVDVMSSPPVITVQLPHDNVDHGRESPRAPSPSSISLSPTTVVSNPFAMYRPHRNSLSRISGPLSEGASGSGLAVQIHPPPDSPMSLNPPTPNHRDIHLESFPSTYGHRRTGSSGRLREGDDRLSASNVLSRRDPPAYSPLDAYTYAEGVHIDLPAEVIAAALESNVVPSMSVGQTNAARSDRRRTRRR